MKTHRLKKKRLLMITGTVCLAALLSFSLEHLHSSIYGVPPGFTGSPLDGITCATLGCHRGPVSSVQDWITTDIPAAGYQPGDTYTVVLTSTRPNTARFGFQMTTQGPLSVEGAFFVTDPVETQYSQGTGYITHTEAGTNGTNGKTWQAKWIAPSDTQATEVTLYAAMVAGEFDVDDEVFITNKKLSSAYLYLNEAISQGEASCFPNPSRGQVILHIPETFSTGLQITVYDPGGEPVKSLEYPYSTDNKYMLNMEALPSGIWFIRATSGKRVYCFKVLKQ